MARAGRNRRSGDRYPSGDLKREKLPPTKLQAQILGMTAREANRVTTAIGRAALEAPELFSGAHVEAGNRFAGFLGRYDSVMGCYAPRTQKSPDYQRELRQGPRLSVDDEPDLALAGSLNTEFQVIRTGLGQAWPVAYNVCLLDFRCFPEDRQTLKSGLDFLIGHFRIRPPETSAQLD